MKRTFWIMTALAAITACAIEPPEPLDQQLAKATTPTERKEILLAACLSEAEWPTLKSRRSHAGSQQRHGSHNPYGSEVRDMKILCKQMDALKDSRPAEKLSPEILAGKCAEQIAVKNKKERKGNVEHIARIQKICDEMTVINIHGRNKR